MREKHHRLFPIHAPTQDQTHNLGMFPDRESSAKPSGVWDNTPTNWATVQGHFPYTSIEQCYLVSTEYSGTIFLAFRTPFSNTAALSYNDFYKLEVTDRFVFNVSSTKFLKP